MGTGVIALEDSPSLLSGHFRVNTSVFVHPHQRKELRVLERCYKEHIISVGVFLR